MLEIKEWKWEKVKNKDKKELTLCCPYCNVRVRTTSDTRIFDVDTGAIKYDIYKCPECYMPITVGITGEIIPPSRFLPFDDVGHLPQKIEKMYNECRKSYANECYCSVVTVARTTLMYLAVDKGATVGLSFVQYIDHLEANGFISSHNRAWVDKIRNLGNHYVHRVDEATMEDAKLAMLFISRLLSSVYELPELAR